MRWSRHIIQIVGSNNDTYQLGLQSVNYVGVRLEMCDMNAAFTMEKHLLMIWVKAQIKLTLALAVLRQPCGETGPDTLL